MEKSNLRLYSNIYPWKGKWKEGHDRFVSKIWNDKALGILKVAEGKKELRLTPYQERLHNNTLQCMNLPKGERPWGWIGVGKEACRCRKANCPKFMECRKESGILSDKEKEIWEGGNREGLDAFEAQWMKSKTRECEPTERDTGNVDVAGVFNGKEEYETVNTGPQSPSEPKIASRYPDDEEYE